MANPQLEDGYTSIANEYLDALVRANLTGAQYQIMLLVIRQTWGWNKKRDILSYGQIAKKTSLHRHSVIREVKKLVANKLLGVANTLPVNTFELQKDYDKWVVADRLLVASKRLGGSKQVTKTGSKQVTHKRKERNYTKEKIYKSFFENDFWPNYPTRNGKKLQEKAARDYIQKNVSESHFKRLVAATKNYRQSEAATGGYAKDAFRWLKTWHEWEEPEKRSEASHCTLSDGTPLTKKEWEGMVDDKTIIWNERKKKWEKASFA